MTAFGDFSFFEGFDHGRSLADAATERCFEVNFLNRSSLSRFGFKGDWLRQLFSKCLVSDHVDAFGGRVGDLRSEEPDGAESVVVAGNDVVDNGGIAVGVDNRDDRNA